MSMYVYEQYLALKSRLSEEQGQTAIEYGLVLALIAVVIVVAMATGLVGTGGVVGDIIQDVRDAISGGATPAE